MKPSDEFIVTIKRLEYDPIFKCGFIKTLAPLSSPMYVHLCAYNIIAPNYFLTGRNMRIDNIYVLGMYLSYLA